MEFFNSGLSKTSPGGSMNPEFPKTTFCKALLATLMACASVGALAQQIEHDTDLFLHAFKQNPARTMQVYVPKYDSNGNRLTPGQASRTQHELTDLFLGIRNHQRANFCNEDGCLGDPGRSAIQGNDEASDLVDSPSSMIVKLETMEAFRSGAVDVAPWSSDYWPIRNGQIAVRYRDRSFPANPGRFTWAQAWAYFLANPFGSASAVDNLSPAEKYDLLVGDGNFTLTKNQWSQGQWYQEQHGNVESWMGLCHGWAAAAYLDARPTQAVQMTAVDGTKINFYPDDIKALSVLKWSNGSAVLNGVAANRFIGGRCNSKEPKIDEASGRIDDQECFDTNPGTFHLALVNQIGRNKRSMVMDATFDYEVWNQPIKSYSYQFFNPKTKARASNFVDASVALNDPSFNDNFKDFRDNPAAKKVVGIIMEVEYVAETSPSLRETDSEANDATTTARYMYDLELNAQGGIVGGEWYQNAHPDFLWNVAPGAFAFNQEDRAVSSAVTPDEAPAADITRAARSASRNGRPLKAVVDALLEQAQGE
jgi:hypothetical protein